MIAIFAETAELPGASAVWGRENRALPAAERSALCWLTLARLLGWEPELRFAGDDPELGPGVRCAVIARNPATITAAETALIAARMELEPMLLVSPAPPPGTPLAELTGVAAAGRSIATAALSWRGPGDAREWEAWPTVDVARCEQTAKVPGPLTVWAAIGEAPLVVAREAGQRVRRHAGGAPRRADRRGAVGERPA